MNTNRGWRSLSIFSFTILGLVLGSLSHAADRGTTTGIASFHAQGEVTEHKAGVIVWIGKFFGVSITDARKGPLNNSGWDCTGESTIHDGQVHQSDGFCVVTDSDGDVINLVWEQTNVPAATSTAKTKGTYLSGTGKYEGIQGYYTFSCELGGIVCDITAGEYQLP